MWHLGILNLHASRSYSITPLLSIIVTLSLEMATTLMSLPRELHRQIAQLIPESLTNLCRTSRDWNDVTSPLLYNQMTTTILQGQRPTKLTIATLNNRPIPSLKDMQAHHDDAHAKCIAANASRQHTRHFTLSPFTSVSRNLEGHVERLSFGTTASMRAGLHRITRAFDNQLHSITYVAGNSSVLQ